MRLYWFFSIQFHHNPHLRMENIVIYIFCYKISIWYFICSALAYDKKSLFIWCLCMVRLRLFKFAIFILSGCLAGGCGVSRAGCRKISFPLHYSLLQPTNIFHLYEKAFTALWIPHAACPPRRQPKKSLQHIQFTHYDDSMVNDSLIGNYYWVKHIYDIVSYVCLQNILGNLSIYSPAMCFTSICKIRKYLLGGINQAEISYSCFHC